MIRRWPLERTRARSTDPMARPPFTHTRERVRASLGQTPPLRLLQTQRCAHTRDDAENLARTEPLGDSMRLLPRGLRRRADGAERSNASRASGRTPKTWVEGSSKGCASPGEGGVEPFSREPPDISCRCTAWTRGWSSPRPNRRRRGPRLCAAPAKGRHRLVSRDAFHRCSSHSEKTISPKLRPPSRAGHRER